MTMPAGGEPIESFCPGEIDSDTLAGLYWHAARTALLLLDVRPLVSARPRANGAGWSRRAPAADPRAMPCLRRARTASGPRTDADVDELQRLDCAVTKSPARGRAQCAISPTLRVVVGSGRDRRGLGGKGTTSDGWPELAQQSIDNARSPSTRYYPAGAVTFTLRLAKIGYRKRSLRASATHQA